MANMAEADHGERHLANRRRGHTGTACPWPDRTAATRQLGVRQRGRRLGLPKVSMVTRFVWMGATWCSPWLRGIQLRRPIASDPLFIPTGYETGTTFRANA
jgi:hypothetical protein